MLISIFFLISYQNKLHFLKFNSFKIFNKVAITKYLLLSISTKIIIINYKGNKIDTLWFLFWNAVYRVFSWAVMTNSKVKKNKNFVTDFFFNKSPLLAPILDQNEKLFAHYPCIFGHETSTITFLFSHFIFSIHYSCHIPNNKKWLILVKKKTKIKKESHNNLSKNLILF